MWFHKLHTPEGFLCCESMRLAWKAGLDFRVLIWESLGKGAVCTSIDICLFNACSLDDVGNCLRNIILLISCFSHSKNCFYIIYFDFGRNWVLELHCHVRHQKLLDFNYSFVQSGYVWFSYTKTEDEGSWGLTESLKKLELPDRGPCLSHPHTSLSW